MLSFDALPGRTTFVVGSGKNAGKTTFLNLAARHLRARGPVALATVGVDGERTDQIYGHAKPRVPVEAGDLVLTTDAAARASAADFEWLHVFSFASVLGRMVAVRARRDDDVELVGPDTNSQLGVALGFLRTRLGAETVLVDGAVNRVTHAAAALDGPVGVIEVVRAEPANRQSALDRLALLARIAELGPPPADAGPLHEVAGAFTRDRLGALPEDCAGVLVEDFTRLFVSATDLRRLGCPVYVRRHIELLAVVVNAFDVDEAALHRAVAEGPLAGRLVLNPFKERSGAAGPP